MLPPESNSTSISSAGSLDQLVQFALVLADLKPPLVT